MTTTRRRFIQASASMAALAVAPNMLRAQAAPPASKTLRAVILQDLRVFDPVISTSLSTNYHSAMVYDTLFGVDDKRQPKPQMLSGYTVSEDQLTYTFELRNGLKFSDGTPVTSADCVASMRRWAARTAAASGLFSRVVDTPIKNNKTFQLVLREPYGLVIDTLSKDTTPALYIMRKQEADTNPSQAVKEIVGSGPFTFNHSLSRSGASYVYDRNPLYVPRPEPASGTAGGKVVKLDRVIWENMTDEMGTIAALQSDEIDFYETPPMDLVSGLEADPNIHVEALNKSGLAGIARLNHLYPPFNNVKARQAMLYLVNQLDVMKVAVGNPKYYRTCASLFGCDTPMENDANTGWAKEGQNLNKAAQLFKESGYDGRPIVILQPTDLQTLSVPSQLIAQWLRQIGVNVDLVASDWGAVSVRRNVKAPPEKGGWNIFCTFTSTAQLSNPVFFWGHSAGGSKSGYLGWPSNEEHEKLRADWAMATTLQERQLIARKMQAAAWDWVPHVNLGQWQQPQAWRKNVNGFLTSPELIPFWNVEKT
jgi:peptide/nickel transport system substrate-binding protein